MRIPIETKPALWGAVGGAVALAFTGFTWGGWTTGSRAEEQARTRADDAVVAALAPICVDRFERASDAAAQRVALLKIDTWSQGDFIEKGGWAAITTVDKAQQRIAAVASACAALLVQGS